MVVIDGKLAAHPFPIIENGTGTRLSHPVVGMADGLGMDAVRITKDMTDGVEIVDRVHGTHIPLSLSGPTTEGQLLGFPSGIAAVPDP